MGRLATPLWVAGCVIGLLVGCQSNAPGMGTRMTAHAAMIDFAGLRSAQKLDDVNVRAAVPSGWDAMPPQVGGMFTHRQWRSPTRATAVGVAKINLPLPVSAKTLIWFARSHYGEAFEKRGGRVLGQWTDNLGREWFEAETDKYHLRGYVVVDGFDAWAVYVGYRRHGEARLAEIGLAVRGMESVVPVPLEGK